MSVSSCSKALDEDAFWLGLVVFWPALIDVMGFHAVASLGCYKGCYNVGQSSPEDADAALAALRLQADSTPF